MLVTSDNHTAIITNTHTQASHANVKSKCRRKKKEKKNECAKVVVLAGCSPGLQDNCNAGILQATLKSEKSHEAGASRISKELCPAQKTSQAKNEFG